MNNPFPKQYCHKDFKWSAPWGTSTFAQNDMGHIFGPLFRQRRVGPTCKLLHEVLPNKRSKLVIRSKGNMLCIHDAPNKKWLILILHYMLPSLRHLKKNQAELTDQQGSLMCQADLIPFLPLGKLWKFLLCLDDSWNDGIKEKTIN